MSQFVVLISGNGSTLQALIDATQTGALPKDCLRGVVSNIGTAYGLERAKAAHIPCHVLSHADFLTRESFDVALAESIFQLCPDDPIVVLAGFMRILSPGFVTTMQGRIVNIHPALLPAYKGLHTYERALEAGETMHGTTVHMVDASLDGGPILAQARVPIQSNDTPETLKTRVQEKERALYPKVLALICDNRLQLQNPPLFDGEVIPASGLVLGTV